MASMFDTIADMLRGSAPDDLAHALGTDRTQTRRAMEIGLPALITGLRDKTLEPGGAQSLAAMLDDTGAALPTDVDAYLGAGDPSRGAAMLDAAFGDRGEPALGSLAEASGLSTRLLAQVMSVLAPLATGVLRSSAPSDADGLRSYLAGAVDDLEGKGFGRVVELVSPDTPGKFDASVGAAPPVAEVIDVKGPSDLDVVIDSGNATVVQGAFPGSNDHGLAGFGDDLDLDAADDLPNVSVPDFGPGPGFNSDVIDVADSPLATSPYPSDSFDADFDLGGETPIVDPKIDFDERGGLSAVGWLWWLIGAILAVLVLLFLVSKCTGDDASVAGGPVGSTTTPTPTVDPLEAQRQATLDAILVDYPGVTGDMVGEVAVLTGTVGDLRTNALLDGAVRDSGLGVQNNVTVDESAIPVPEGYSLNDLIAAQPQLSTLRSLLDQAGLGEALAANGPYTLFAPTNDSFDAIQTELAAVQSDPTLLSAYLQYHLLSGAQSEADVGASETLTTISGEIIDVSTVGGAARLNDFVSILRGDAEARNGVMHVVSGVLVPKSQVPVPGELGELLALNPVPFSPGSSDLTDAGRIELDKVVAFLLDTPIDVEIAGHTDADGDEALNQKLSQERADAVLTYLTSQGIPAESLTAVGYGETEPIAPNDSSANKAKNRRIEFRTS